MYQVITGMSQVYYDLIGKEMISSWLKFWPENFVLEVYSEDDLNITHPRINVISLKTMDDDYHNFQNLKLNKLSDRTKTFAKKAWPIMKNLETDKGKLIWVDADVITTGNITTEWLDSLMTNDHFSSHLGVFQSEYYAVETGFFIINRSNKFKKNFLERYKNIYINRNFEDMKKPFDGDVFGKVLRDMKTIENFSVNDLNKNYGKLSPFNKVFEGKMMHFKAKRKFEKFSNELPHV